MSNIHQFPWSSDFFRPMLRETAERIVTPELYILDWYYELLSLKESTEGRYGSELSEAEDFYSLLVHYGRFLRILPEFLDENVNQLMKWAQGVFERMEQENFQKALGIFQPDQWLADAKTISDAWKNDQIEENEARSHTIVLFTDYDDIRICIELAWKKWGNDSFIERFSNAMVPCDQWIENDEYLVDLASLWYQTNACMLNGENDLDHAMTLDHFIAQLDKLEANWKDMNEPILQMELQGIENEFIVSLPSKFQYQPSARWLGILEGVAAEESNQSELKELRSMTWLNPEGEDKAILKWSMPITENSKYNLSVFSPGFKIGMNSPYAERKIRLGKYLWKTLDCNGSVIFQYDEIKAFSNHSLDLYVENSSGNMIQWNEKENENVGKH